MEWPTPTRRPDLCDPDQATALDNKARNTSIINDLDGAHYVRTVNEDVEIVGSAVDIALRLAFALKPSRMFKRDVPAPGPVPKVLSLSDLRKLDALAVEETPSVSELELRTRTAEAAAAAAAFNLKLNSEGGGGATDSVKKEQ